jgi:hypothetical protein
MAEESRTAVKWRGSSLVCITIKKHWRTGRRYTWSKTTPARSPPRPAWTLGISISFTSSGSPLPRLCAASRPPTSVIILSQSYHVEYHANILLQIFAWNLLYGTELVRAKVILNGGDVEKYTCKLDGQPCSEPLSMSFRTCSQLEVSLLLNNSDVKWIQTSTSGWLFIYPHRIPLDCLWGIHRCFQYLDQVHSEHKTDKTLKTCL